MRVRLVISYDGSGFHGFAVQPGQRTVGGTLTASLERYLRHTVDLTCGGRTDAGVHARGQVVSFDARSNVDPVRLQHILNKALRPAVAIRDASIVEATFDARRSATGRRYRYTVLNRPVPDPFLAGSSWHLAPPLDISAMRLACDPLHGEHDFSSFCRKPPSPGASLVRRVRSAIWSEQGDGVLIFEVEASSFCHQMVRSVVGTLVDVGLGRTRAGDMTGIIAARQRSAAGQPAPPQGLCLWEISYL